MRAVVRILFERVIDGAVSKLLQDLGDSVAKIYSEHWSYSFPMSHTDYAHGSRRESRNVTNGRSASRRNLTVTIAVRKKYI